MVNGEPLARSPLAFEVDRYLGVVRSRRHDDAAPTGELSLVYSMVKERRADIALPGFAWKAGIASVGCSYWVTKVPRSQACLVLMTRWACSNDGSMCRAQ